MMVICNVMQLNEELSIVVGRPNKRQTDSARRQIDNTLNLSLFMKIKCEYILFILSIKIVTEINFTKTIK